MPWTGDQINTFGPQPSRVFKMDATMHGLPADILHIYDHGSASMHVKAASIATLTKADGPEMDQAETVTVLNDLCVLAPGALVDAPIDWSIIDNRHVRARYTNEHHTVTA